MVEINDERDQGSCGTGEVNAAANQPVIDWGWVMAVPTTTQCAPAASAALACAGVWIRPSATIA
jgi:hypothetical protein